MKLLFHAPFAPISTFRFASVSPSNSQMDLNPRTLRCRKRVTVTNLQPRPRSALFEPTLPAMSRCVERRDRSETVESSTDGFGPVGREVPVFVTPIPGRSIILVLLEEVSALRARAIEDRPLGAIRQKARPHAVSPSVARSASYRRKLGTSSSA